MADQKAEEKRHADMLEGLNKGIKEANGQMTDKEFVLIKRAKRLGRMAKRTVKEFMPGVAKKAQGQTSRREQQLLDEEK